VNFTIPVLALVLAVGLAISTLLVFALSIIVATQDCTVWVEKPSKSITASLN
jgi:hypothetical protein